MKNKLFACFGSVKKGLLLKLFAMIIFGVLVPGILMSACTPKKSAEQIAMEARIAELQAELQALTADEAEEEPAVAETEPETRQRRRRERAAELEAEIAEVQTELAAEESRGGQSRRSGGASSGGRRQQAEAPEETPQVTEAPASAPAVSQAPAQAQSTQTPAASTPVASQTPPAQTQTTQTPVSYESAPTDDPARVEKIRAEIADVAAKTAEAARGLPSNMETWSGRDSQILVATVESLFPGIARADISTDLISNTEDWDRVTQRIRTNFSFGGKKTEAYRLVIDGDIGIPGNQDSREATFSPLVGTYGIYGKIYAVNNAVIAITGKGRLYLTSPGYMITLNETLIIDGDVILEGLTAGKNGSAVNNNRALIAVAPAESDGSAGLELRKGAITGNTGGSGVYVRGRNTKFIMSGGTITGNTASGGGGVFVSESGNGFTMSGGTISGNKAENGGGVLVSWSQFTMTGGSINGNTAKQGGGVYFPGLPSIEKTGGVIGMNTATDGNTWGHTIYANRAAEAMTNTPELLLFRDAGLASGDTIRINLFMDGNIMSQFPAARGQTLNGLTRK